ncbi:MAG: ABC transporter ATP-binding protein [Candidatus Peribacteria bacterium]|nr:MAG: ABC transporter ATP-binding protein [Candidatus Peribacteria bacterium]
MEIVMLLLLYKQIISLGEFFSLLFYSFFLFNPLYELPTVAANYQEAKASNATLEEIHQIPLEIIPPDAKEIGTIKSLHFADVSFAYEEHTPVLQHISLDICQGQTIAFV